MSVVKLLELNQTVIHLFLTIGINDAELLCGDCVRDNHAEEYAQSLINKERLANTILTDDNLEELGFIRVESDFESGWYDRNG